MSFLENKGGSPRNVGEDYIEAYVPVTLLGQASEQPGVIRVHEIIPSLPAQTKPACKKQFRGTLVVSRASCIGVKAFLNLSVNSRKARIGRLTWSEL